MAEAGFLTGGLNRTNEFTSSTKVGDNEVCGGAVAVFGNGRLLNSVVTNNTAVYRGGGVVLLANGVVRNCQIVDNSAVSEGGGLFMERNDTDALVADSTISGNRSFISSVTVSPREVGRRYFPSLATYSLLVMVDNRGNTIKDLLRAKRILPVTRVVIKATEGERMSDSRFDAYWEEAGAHPLTRGAYHFFRSSKDPVKQATHYIRHVRLRHSDLPPILDVETMHPGCSKEQLNRKVLLWLQTVEKHYGRTPIVYASDSYARDILSPEITRHYPMWIARYNEQPPRFEPWTMWQFTDKALIYGAPGYVDLSVIQ